jgi:hypothetical protein
MQVPDCTTLIDGIVAFDPPTQSNRPYAEILAANLMARSPILFFHQ